MTYYELPTSQHTRPFEDYPGFIVGPSELMHEEETRRGLLVVRTFGLGDEVSDVTGLVRKAYAAHEPGEGDQPKFRQSQQTNEMTLNHMSWGTTLLAEMDGQLAGMSTYYPPKEITGAPGETHPPAAAVFNRPGVAEWGFNAIDPAYQASGARMILRLYEAVERLARRDHVIEIAGRARDDMGAVKNLYGRLGFSAICVTTFPQLPFPIALGSKKLEYADSESGAA